MNKSVAVDMYLAKDTRYIGTMKKGLLHGPGRILFKDNGIYDGVWKYGKLVMGSYKFPDGLDYEPVNWCYCTMVDRRFWTEFLKGDTTDFSQETNMQPTPDLPYNHYDVGDGTYNPENDKIHDYGGIFLRTADDDEKEWIFRCCRRGLSKSLEAECSECLESIKDAIDRELKATETLDNIVNSTEDILLPTHPSSDSSADQVSLSSLSADGQQKTEGSEQSNPLSPSSETSAASSDYDNDATTSDVMDSPSD